MKKFYSVVFTVLIVALALSACSAQKSDISMYELNKAMCAATDKFTGMKYISTDDGNEEETFSNISKMDYSKVGNFFITYAENGKGNADEIAVIEVKNKSDLIEASDSLNAHLEYRKSLYATYDQSQVKKLEKAKVITYGSIAALIVADDADAIEDAFYNYFSGGENS